MLRAVNGYGITCNGYGSRATGVEGILTCVRRQNDCFTFYGTAYPVRLVHHR